MIATSSRSIFVYLNDFSSFQTAAYNEILVTSSVEHSRRMSPAGMLFQGVRWESFLQMRIGQGIAGQI